MASGARVAQFSPVRIGVTCEAVGLKTMENSAGQDLALPRLVALGALDLCVAAGQLKFGIFIMVE